MTRATANKTEKNVVKSTRKYLYLVKLLLFQRVPPGTSLSRTNTAHTTIKLDNTLKLSC